MKRKSKSRLKYTLKDFKRFRFFNKKYKFLSMDKKIPEFPERFKFCKVYFEVEDKSTDYIGIWDKTEEFQKVNPSFSFKEWNDFIFSERYVHPNGWKTFGAVWVIKNKILQNFSHLSFVKIVAWYIHN